MLGLIVSSVAVALVADALLDEGNRKTIRRRIRALRRLRSMRQRTAASAVADDPAIKIARQRVAMLEAVAAKHHRDSIRWASDWTLGQPAKKRALQAMDEALLARRELKKLEGGG